MAEARADRPVTRFATAQHQEEQGPCRAIADSNRRNPESERETKQRRQDPEKNRGNVPRRPRRVADVRKSSQRNRNVFFYRARGARALHVQQQAIAGPRAPYRTFDVRPPLNRMPVDAHDDISLAKARLFRPAFQFVHFECLRVEIEARTHILVAMQHLVEAVPRATQGQCVIDTTNSAANARLARNLLKKVFTAR